MGAAAQPLWPAHGPNCASGPELCNGMGSCQTDLASDDQTPMAGLVAPVQIAWRCYALTVAEAGAGVSPSCLAQIADLLNRQAVRRIVSG